VIISVEGGSAPLCPYDFGHGAGPYCEAHRLHVRMSDAFYTAAEKDENGGLTPPLSEAYEAAVSIGSSANRMDLFTESASTMHGGRIIWVEVWYWKCRVCGFVLSAQAEKK
jgi:rubrerythrin